MAEVEDSSFEIRKLAHDYAWNWFQYHAGQRMNVFRFYLILVVILITGTVKLYELEYFWLSTLVSAIIFVTSVLFSRLDTRSADLIKISERHLVVSEKQLALIVGDSIKLSYFAEKKDNVFAREHKPNIFFSFRTILHKFFVIFGTVGLISALLSAYMALCAT